MARNQENVHVARDWVEITGGDATVISFQIVSLEDREADGVYIRVTENSTAPTEVYGLLYQPPYGELNRSVSDLAIGLSAPTRVWARAISNEVVVLQVSDDSA